MNLRFQFFIEKAIIITIFDFGSLFGLLFKPDSLITVSIATLMTGAITLVTDIYR